MNLTLDADADTDLSLVQYLGRPWPQVRNKVRKEYPSVQLTAWTVCMITFFLCFTFYKCPPSLDKLISVKINFFYSQFWPVVGWINYRYMPLQFRVVFHSFVACCWYLVHLHLNLVFLVFVVAWD